MLPNQILVPTAEARAALGNPSLSTFYRLIFDGHLEARKLGAHVYITAQSLYALPDKLHAAPSRKRGVK
jgi:hypothetical protein